MREGGARGSEYEDYGGQEESVMILEHKLSPYWGAKCVCKFVEGDNLNVHTQGQKKRTFTAKENGVKTFRRILSHVKGILVVDYGHILHLKASISSKM